MTDKQICLNDKVLDEIGLELECDLKYIDCVYTLLCNLETTVSTEFVGDGEQYMMQCIAKFKEMLTIDLEKLNSDFYKELLEVRKKFGEVDESIANSIWN